LLLARFNIYPEFKETLTFNKVSAIRYIILMYDLNNSEIQALYPDYMTRKRSCAMMAGFTVTKNRFAKEVEGAIIGMDQVFNRMIVRYIRLFNNPEYVSYVAYWEMLIKNVEMSMGEDNAQELTRIRGNIEGLRINIAKITEEVFRGDKTIELKKELYKSMEEERLALRPEDIAAAIQSKNLAFSKKADIHQML
jgi:hypothetical protein